jgi:hypothetical protein
VVTYGRLLQVARQGLWQAEAAEYGSFHNLVSSIVFSAFSVEAYLNHIGASGLQPAGWQDRLPVRKKLECILREIGLAPDFSERPFSSFDAMFRFRNLLAHGRTEQIRKEYEADLDEGVLVLGPIVEWELTCTYDNAKRFFSDAEAMITAIHEKTGLDTPALGFLGGTGSVITPL